MGESNIFEGLFRPTNIGGGYKDKLNELADYDGITVREVLENLIDLSYMTKILKGKKTREKLVIEPEYLAGLINTFNHKTGIFKKVKGGFYVDCSNYDVFARWFNKIQQDYKEKVLEYTIEKERDRWYRVINHGTFVGKPAEQTKRYLEDMGVFSTIYEYKGILEVLEREKKEEVERIKRKREVAEAKEEYYRRKVDTRKNYTTKKENKLRSWLYHPRPR